VNERSVPSRASSRAAPKASTRAGREASGGGSSRSDEGPTAP
jgi:hypothetical protein